MIKVLKKDSHGRSADSITRRSIATTSKITINTDDIRRPSKLSSIQEESTPMRYKKHLSSVKSSNALRSQVSVRASSMVRGKPADFLEERKENILNSMFNKRKRDLLAVTRQNKKIYERINSQHSNYSSKKLNQSYESNCSKSRTSLRSSGKSKNNSRATSAKKKAPHRRYLIDVGEAPVIKSNNINKMGLEDVRKFQNVFFNDNHIKAREAEIPTQKSTSRSRRPLKQNVGSIAAVVEQKCSGMGLNNKYSKKKGLQAGIKCLAQYRNKNFLAGLAMPTSKLSNERMNRMISNMAFKPHNQ